MTARLWRLNKYNNRAIWPRDDRNQKIRENLDDGFNACLGASPRELGDPNFWNSIVFIIARFNHPNYLNRTSARFDYIIR